MFRDNDEPAATIPLFSEVYHSKLQFDSSNFKIYQKLKFASLRVIEIQASNNNEIDMSMITDKLLSFSKETQNEKTLVEVRPESRSKGIKSHLNLLAI